MAVDIVDKDSKDNFDVWLGNIVKDSEKAVEDVANELGNVAVAEMERRLLILKRKGKVPISRGVHMYQDVKKVKSKKYGYISIGGGKKTATLYHLVNDGTYRTFPTHFMDSVINDLDSKIDTIWDRKGDL